MLHQAAGISAHELKRLKDKGITEKDIKIALPLLSFQKELWRAPLCKLNVMFYIDRWGDFMSNKTKTAEITRAVYNSLEKSEQNECVKYLMESDDG